jgi:uncharacterized DUF497 family protein
MKRKANKRKHDMDLADGYAAFDAPMVTREDARDYKGEQRFVSLGLVKDKIVVLVWTDDGGGPDDEADVESEPRLISCREAEPHEQKEYFLEFPKI